MSALFFMGYSKAMLGFSDRNSVYGMRDARTGGLIFFEPECSERSQDSGDPNRQSGSQNGLCENGLDLD